MNPLIITCAITGAETTKERQPALPITAQDQAIAAQECVAAGASIIHLHVRDAQGRPSQELDHFRESINQIKSHAPQAIIQISTGGAVGESIENRARPLSLRPEMASLNLGTTNFGEDVFMNHPRDIEGLACKMTEYGVMPELEVYEAGMVESGLNLYKKGILKDPLHFQFVLGVPGAMSGDLRHLMHLLSLIPSQAHWGVAGVGRFQLPLATHAILLGGHVRVGFEDNVYYSKGVLAKSNAELVARIVRLAKELGREVATPVQARQILGLKNA
jgi:3-keto-5-aminohexanoate cleavage enzyme